MTAPALSETAIALCLAWTFLTPLAAAGLALMNTGLGRSRNAAHAMLSTLCVVAVAALVYFAVGWSWQGYPGGPAHIWTIHGKPWSGLGAGRYLMRGLELDSSRASLEAVFGMFCAGLAAVIPLGAGAERWRMSAVCGSTALMAGCTYPLFAHWAWGGGWLAQLGVNYRLGGGFIDSGGAGAIQAVGGLTALAVIWILGPRRAKYSGQGVPGAIPGHNAPVVLLGCFLAWLGWLGLDCAGAVLFTGVATSRAALIAVNATLAAASGLLCVAFITRGRFGKIDASLCANGWVAGLVASSAGCAVVRPAAAVLIGATAGALVVFAVEWLELHLRVDDPGGVVAAHALAGLWGLLAVGLFAEAGDQWIAQLAGVATLIGFVLPVSYGLNWVLDRVSGLRVAPIGERQGMDLYELGAGAYPDFPSHNEEFW